MRLLIYSGFNPRQKDNYWQTPLHLTCINGNITAVKELCEQVDWYFDSQVLNVIIFIYRQFFFSCQLDKVVWQALTRGFDSFCFLFFSFFFSSLLIEEWKNAAISLFRKICLWFLAWGYFDPNCMSRQSIFGIAHLVRALLCTLKKICFTFSPCYPLIWMKQLYKTQSVMIMRD